MMNLSSVETDGVRRGARTGRKLEVVLVLVVMEVAVVWLGDVYLHPQRQLEERSAQIKCALLLLHMNESHPAKYLW